MKSESRLEIATKDPNRVSENPGATPTPVDFSRPERLPKAQIRSVQTVFENFLRWLSASLSAHLRSRVTASLTGVKQCSYADFAGAVSSPILVPLDLKPYRASAVLSLSPSLVFLLLEMVLGAKSGSATSVQRGLTEIEEKVLDGLLQIVASALRQAWGTVSGIEFKMDGFGSALRDSQYPEPAEPVVMFSAKLSIGETSADMSLSIPPAVIRREFDQSRDPQSREREEPGREGILEILQGANTRLEARLQGPLLAARDLLSLEEGDVLVFPHSLGRNVDCLVNGKVKFKGKIVSSGSRLGFHVVEHSDPGW